MHILKTNFEGNENIGLYGFATEKYCILAKRTPKFLADKVSEVLQVPVFLTNIAGTGMVGAFLNGNSHCLLVPSIAFKEEIDFLKEKGLPVTVIDTHLTCLGNNLVCNDSGAIISTEYSEEEIKTLSEALQVPVEVGTIAEIETIGSCIVISEKYGLIHRDATQEDVIRIEKLLKVKVQTGTISMGSPYIRSGIIANKFGFIVSDSSGGPELVNAESALGYIEV